MSGFLARLSQRVVAPETLLRPRAASMFDAEAIAPAQPESKQDEQETTGVSQSLQSSASAAPARRVESRRAGEPAAVPAAAVRAEGEQKVSAQVAPPSKQATSQRASRAAIATPSASRAAEAPAHSDRLREPESEAAAVTAEQLDRIAESVVRHKAESAAPAPHALPPSRSPRTESPAAAVEDQRPVVHVTIGRIEVRAPAPVARSEHKPSVPRPRASQTLDDYLSARRK